MSRAAAAGLVLALFASEPAARAAPPESPQADALADAASARLLLGDYAGAEADLKRALGLAPGHPEASLRLAEALRDRPREALPHARRAARASAMPRRRAAAQRLVAAIELDLGRRRRARSSLRRALGLAGEDLETLRDLARLERGRPRKASAYALRALRAAEAAPLWQRAAAYRLCAGLWLELEEGARAAESLRRALDIEPDDVETLQALLRLKKERPGEAAPEAARAAAVPALESPLDEEALQRALRADPEDLEALRRLVALALGRGRSEEARALTDRFERAVGDAPSWQQASAHRLAARLRLEQGRREKANEDIAQALALNWNSLESAALAARIDFPYDPRRTTLRALADAYHDSALAHRDLGETARARECLERALALDPGHAASLGLRMELALDSVPGYRPAHGPPAGGPCASPDVSTKARAALALRLCGYPAAVLLHEKGRSRDALELLSSRPPAEARLAAGWLAARALIEEALGDEAGFRRDLAQALAKEPRQACLEPLAFLDRGRLAPDYFDLCLARFPEDPALLLDRGVARYARGRKAEAVADFRRALALRGGDFPEAASSLAAALKDGP